MAHAGFSGEETCFRNSSAPRFTLSRSERSISMTATFTLGTFFLISLMADLALGTDREAMYTFAFCLGRTLVVASPLLYFIGFGQWSEREKTYSPECPPVMKTT